MCQLPNCANGKLYPTLEQLLEMFENKWYDCYPMMSYSFAKSGGYRGMSDVWNEWYHFSAWTGDPSLDTGITGPILVDVTGTTKKIAVVKALKEVK